LAKPTSIHTAAYTAANSQSHADGRLFSTTFERNSPPIIAALTPWLSGVTGTVLEIGCGTGQHAGACSLAFPNLRWQTSDPYADHRASARAWATYLRLNTPAPLDLDASGDWAAREDIAQVGGLSAVISMNVIHIAPIAVAHGIISGAGKALLPGGVLMFYGPFKRNGSHIGAGNAAFDSGLRAENPDWGIRDSGEIEELGAEAGLEIAALQAMPANNRLLVLRKSANT